MLTSDGNIEPRFAHMGRLDLSYLIVGQVSDSGSPSRESLLHTMLESAAWLFDFQTAMKPTRRCHSERRAGFYPFRIECSDSMGSFFT